MWCFGGDTKLQYREELSLFIAQQVQDSPDVDLQPEMLEKGGLIIDFQVTLEEGSVGQWKRWEVDEVEIDSFGGLKKVQ